MVKRGVPLGEWSGSDATERLRAVVEQQHKETAKQTRVMVRLTWAMFALTFVTVLATFIQVVLAYSALTR
jgi:uncharacterized membrane protein